MNKKPIKIVLDVDDILTECNQSALDRLADDTGEMHSIYEVTEWGSNGPLSERLKYFDDGDFFRQLVPSEGAKEFVSNLAKRNAEIIVATAVPLKFAHIRAEWITANFPEIEERNILLGARKDLLAVDVLLDDCPGNIATSIAKYPVLFHQPWNKDVTDTLAVNTLDEALTLIDTILSDGEYLEPVTVNPEIVCLIGPSGSGKEAVSNKLVELGYIRPLVYTTKDIHRNGYTLLDADTFHSMEADGKFIETTTYEGDYYGVLRSDMDDAITKGRIVLTTDYCGVNALKTAYGSGILAIYLRQDHHILTADIMSKYFDLNDKISHIKAYMESEEKIAPLCDAILDSDEPAINANQIDKLLDARKAPVPADGEVTSAE